LEEKARRDKESQREGRSQSRYGGREKKIQWGATRDTAGF
jgi:hypothetical protein